MQTLISNKSHGVPSWIKSERGEKMLKKKNEKFMRHRSTREVENWDANYITAQTSPARRSARLRTKIFKTFYIEQAPMVYWRETLFFSEYLSAPFRMLYDLRRGFDAISSRAPRVFQLRLISAHKFPGIWYFRWKLSHSGSKRWTSKRNLISLNWKFFSVFAKADLKAARAGHKKRKIFLNVNLFISEMA